MANNGHHTLMFVVAPVPYLVPVFSALMFIWTSIAQVQASKRQLERDVYGTLHIGYPLASNHTDYSMMSQYSSGSLVPQILEAHFHQRSTNCSDRWIPSTYCHYLTRWNDRWRRCWIFMAGEKWKSTPSRPMGRELSRHQGAEIHVSRILRRNFACLGHCGDTQKVPLHRRSRPSSTRCTVSRPMGNGWWDIPPAIEKSFGWSTYRYSPDGGLSRPLTIRLSGFMS